MTKIKLCVFVVPFYLTKTKRAFLFVWLKKMALVKTENAYVERLFLEILIEVYFLFSIIIFPIFNFSIFENVTLLLKYKSDMWQLLRSSKWIETSSMSLNLFIWALKKLRLIRQTALEPSIHVDPIEVTKLLSKFKHCFKIRSCNNHNQKFLN